MRDLTWGENIILKNVLCGGQTFHVEIGIYSDTSPSAGKHLKKLEQDLPAKHGHVQISREIRPLHIVWKVVIYRFELGEVCADESQVVVV